MYQKVIEDIKRNLGENKNLNRKYLISQVEIYKTHEHSTEIITEISKMIWDCLTPEEQELYAKIMEEETPVRDILIKTEFYIQNNDYKTALENLDEFMKTFQKMYENDEINEYHQFSSPIEELLFREYKNCEKELQFIPENQPLEELYYAYGFLLRDASRLDEAENALKEALSINPVSTRVILELCDLYKMRAPTFNRFYFHNMDALKYAYSGQDLARAYRNLGFFYYEENNDDLALACYYYSLRYEDDPLIEDRIMLIEKNNPEFDRDKCEELIKSKHIQLGPNPFVVENLKKLAIDYENQKLFSQSLYFYRLLYSLEKTTETFKKIKEMDLKTRQMKRKI